MSLRTILLWLFLALVALFAAVNWPAMVTPTELSLIVTTFQAPLGLSLLGLLAVQAVVFLAYIAALQAQRLAEIRRLTNEAQQQRALADKAEGSRLAELQRWLTTELAELRSTVGQTASTVSTQVHELDERLRSAIGDTGNSLAASLGEIEDKLDRQVLRPHQEPPAAPVAPHLPGPGL